VVPTQHLVERMSVTLGLFDNNASEVRIDCFYLFFVTQSHRTLVLMTGNSSDIS
jgi:hypothetical protein